MGPGQRGASAARFRGEERNLCGRRVRFLLAQLAAAFCLRLEQIALSQMAALQCKQRRARLALEWITRCLSGASRPAGVLACEGCACAIRREQSDKTIILIVRRALARLAESNERLRARRRRQCRQRRAPPRTSRGGNDIRLQRRAESEKQRRRQDDAP
jgi:hypothetical protein